MVGGPCCMEALVAQSCVCFDFLPRMRLPHTVQRTVSCFSSSPSRCAIIFVVELKSGVVPATGGAHSRPKTAADSNTNGTSTSKAPSTSSPKLSSSSSATSSNDEVIQKARAEIERIKNVSRHVLRCLFAHKNHPECPFSHTGWVSMLYGLRTTL